MSCWKLKLNISRLKKQLIYFEATQALASGSFAWKSSERREKVRDRDGNVARSTFLRDYFWHLRSQASSLELKQESSREVNKELSRRRKTMSTNFNASRRLSVKWNFHFSLSLRGWEKANSKCDKEIAPLAGWKFEGNCLSWNWISFE